MPQLRKLIALLTLVSFSVQTLAWSTPDLSFTSNQSAEYRLSPPDIQIPAEMGSVKGSFDNPSGTGLILHIQNAHGNYRAQKNIEKLIRHLTKTYGIRSLFLEGANDKLDPSVVRFFDNNRLNLKVADLLMRHGEFTGAEMFLLRGQEKKAAVEGYGIEDTALYRQDFELFRSVIGRQEAAGRFWEEFDPKLDFQESRVFRRELRRFLKEWRAFQKGRAGLFGFIRSLHQYGLRHLSMDIREPGQQEAYGALLRVLKLEALEKRLDPARIEEEKKALLQFLHGKIDKKFYDQLARLESRPGKEIQGHPRFLFEKILEQAAGKGLDLRNYPNFTLFAEYVIFQSEIDSERLFEEAEALSGEIFNALAKTKKQKRLIRLIQDSELVKKLFALELSRKEHAKLLSAKKRLGTDALAARLSRLGVRSAAGSSRPWRPARAGEEARGLFDDALKFYELAQAREKHFLVKTLETLRQEKQSIGIVVTGGFHAEGFQNLLREKGVSHISVIPRMAHAQRGHDSYLSAMMGETKLFESAHLEKALRELRRVSRDPMVGAAVMARDYALNLKAVHYVAASLGEATKPIAGSLSQDAKSQAPLEIKLYSQLAPEEKRAVREKLAAGVKELELDDQQWTGRNEDVLIAYANGEPAGFQGFYMPPTKATSTHGIYVSEKFRNKGLRIGTRLREELLGYLKQKGYEILWILVRPSQESQRFHKKWLAAMDPSWVSVEYHPEDQDIIKSIDVYLTKYQPAKPPSILAASLGTRTGTVVRYALYSGLPVSERQKLEPKLEAWKFKTYSQGWHGNPLDALVAYVGAEPAGLQAFMMHPESRSVYTTGLYVDEKFRKSRYRLGSRIREELLTRLRNLGYQEFNVGFINKTPEAQNFHKRWLARLGKALIAVDYYPGQLELIKAISVDLTKLPSGQMSAAASSLGQPGQAAGGGLDQPALAVGLGQPEQAAGGGLDQPALASSLGTSASESKQIGTTRLVVTAAALQDLDVDGVIVPANTELKPEPGFLSSLASEIGSFFPVLSKPGSLGQAIDVPLVKHVIHAVNHELARPSQADPLDFELSITNALKKADELGLTKIAIPVFGEPVIFRTVARYLLGKTGLTEVFFADRGTRSHYEGMTEQLSGFTPKTHKAFLEAMHHTISANQSLAVTLSNAKALADAYGKSLHFSEFLKSLERITQQPGFQRLHAQPWAALTDFYAPGMDNAEQEAARLILEKLGALPETGFFKGLSRPMALDHLARARSLVNTLSAGNPVYKASWLYGTGNARINMHLEAGYQNGSSYKRSALHLFPVFEEAEFMKYDGILKKTKHNYPGLKNGSIGRVLFNVAWVDGEPAFVISEVQTTEAFQRLPKEVINRYTRLWILAAADFLVSIAGENGMTGGVYAFTGQTVNRVTGYRPSQERRMYEEPYEHWEEPSDYLVFYGDKFEQLNLHKFSGSPLRKVADYQDYGPQLVRFEYLAPEVEGGVQRFGTNRDVYASVVFDRPVDTSQLKMVLHYGDPQTKHRWQDAPEAEIVNDFGNGAYRFRARLPKGAPAYTFKISRDGGLSWGWMGWNVRVARGQSLGDETKIQTAEFSGKILKGMLAAQSDLNHPYSSSRREAIHFLRPIFLALIQQGGNPPLAVFEKRLEDPNEDVREAATAALLEINLVLVALGKEPISLPPLENLAKSRGDSGSAAVDAMAQLNVALIKPALAGSLGSENIGPELAEFLRRKIGEETRMFQSLQRQAPRPLGPESVLAEEPAEIARQTKALEERPAIEQELTRLLAEKINYTPLQLDAGHKAEPELRVRTLEEVERTAILRAIVKQGGNTIKAIGEIGFASGTVYKKLKKYEVMGREDKSPKLDRIQAKLADVIPGIEKLTGSYDDAEKAETLWALWVHEGDIGKASEALGLTLTRGFTRGLGKKLLAWGINASAPAKAERLRQVREQLPKILMAKKERWATILKSESGQTLADRAAMLRADLKNKPADLDRISYAIALYSEAARRAFADPRIDSKIHSYVGGEPQEKQIESALLLLSNRTTVRMLPSEGKTLSVGLAAFLKALAGFKVEVHDWSKLLSARDAQVEGAILNRLGMRVAAVIGKTPYEFALEGETFPHLKPIKGRAGAFPLQRAFGEYDIVYGPYDQMIFLWMNDWVETNNHRIHPFRAPEAVIVEEGDTPLLDNLNKPLAFFKELYKLGDLPDLIYRLVYEYAYTLVEGQKAGKIRYQISSRKVSVLKERREAALRALRAKLASVDGALEFVNRLDLLDLLHAALEAQLIYQEKKQYLVRRKSAGGHKGKIVLINENTGEIHEDERLSRSLHTFLEIKHGLAIQKESNIELVMTAYEFYSRIRSFSAVMGYLGNGDEGRLRQLYDIGVEIMEPFHPNRRIDLESRYFVNEGEKFQYIAELAKKIYLETKRPVLINAQSPFGAEGIERAVRELGFLASPDDLRVIDGQNEEANARDWNRMGDTASITIAAQIASRGQEIKLDPALYENPATVEINGNPVAVAGLFVIGSHHSKSERVEEQVKTRTARRGKPGAALIVDHLAGNRFLEEYVPDELAEFLANPRLEVNSEENRKTVIPLLFELARIRHLRALSLEQAAVGPMFKDLVDAQFRYVSIARKLLEQGKALPKKNFSVFVNAAYYAIARNNPGEFNAVLQNFNRRMIRLAQAASLGMEGEGPAAHKIYKLADPRNPENEVGKLVLFTADDRVVREAYVFFPDQNVTVQQNNKDTQAVFSRWIKLDLDHLIAVNHQQVRTASGAVIEKKTFPHQDIEEDYFSDIQSLVLALSHLIETLRLATSFEERSHADLIKIIRKLAGNVFRARTAPEQVSISQPGGRELKLAILPRETEGLVRIVFPYEEDEARRDPHQYILTIEPDAEIPVTITMQVRQSSGGQLVRVLDVGPDRGQRVYGDTEIIFEDEEEGRGFSIHADDIRWALKKWYEELPAGQQTLFLSQSLEALDSIFTETVDRRRTRFRELNAKLARYQKVIEFLKPPDQSLALKLEMSRWAVKVKSLARRRQDSLLDNLSLIAFMLGAQMEEGAVNFASQDPAIQSDTVNFLDHFSEILVPLITNKAWMSQLRTDSKKKFPTLLKAARLLKTEGRSLGSRIQSQGLPEPAFIKSPAEMEKHLEGLMVVAPHSFMWKDPAIGEAREDLYRWLEKNSGIEWEAGPRYGIAKAKLDFFPGHPLQVLAEEEWQKTFPELEKLQKNRGGFHPDPGAFGQITLSWARNQGQILLIIDEIQPGDGYRKLTKEQRRHLDAWRQRAMARILEWAESRGILVFGTSPEGIKELYPKISDYEIAENYLKSYNPNQWELKIAPLVHGRVMHHAVRPRLWWVYKGNKPIQARKPAAQSLGAESYREEIRQKIRSRNLTLVPLGEGAEAYQTAFKKAIHDRPDVSEFFDHGYFEALQRYGARAEQASAPLGAQNNLRFISMPVSAEISSIDKRITLFLAGDQVLGYGISAYSKPQEKFKQPRRVTAGFHLFKEYRKAGRADLKFKSADIYEAFLGILNAKYQPQEFAVEVEGQIHSKMGSPEDNALFYLKRGFLPSDRAALADQFVTRMLRGERIGPPEIRDLLKASQSRLWVLSMPSLWAKDADAQSLGQPGQAANRGLTEQALAGSLGQGKVKALREIKLGDLFSGEGADRQLHLINAAGDGKVERFLVKEQGEVFYTRYAASFDSLGKPVSRVEVPWKILTPQDAGDAEILNLPALKKVLAWLKETPSRPLLLVETYPVTGLNAIIFPDSGVIPVDYVGEQRMPLLTLGTLLDAKTDPLFQGVKEVEEFLARGASLGKDETIPAKVPVLMIMGRSGSGKTTVGRMLAERLGIPYVSVGDVARERKAAQPGIQINGDQIFEELLTQGAALYSKGVILDAAPGNKASYAWMVELLGQKGFYVARLIHVLANESLARQRIRNRPPRAEYEASEEWADRRMRRYFRVIAPILHEAGRQGIVLTLKNQSDEADLPGKIGRLVEKLKRQGLLDDQNRLKKQSASAQSMGEAEFLAGEIFDKLKSQNDYPAVWEKANRAGRNGINPPDYTDIWDFAIEELKSKEFSVRRSDIVNRAIDLVKADTMEARSLGNAVTDLPADLFPESERRRIEHQMNVLVQAYPKLNEKEKRILLDPQILLVLMGVKPFYKRLGAEDPDHAVLLDALNKIPEFSLHNRLHLGMNPSYFYSAPHVALRLVTEGKFLDELGLIRNEDQPLFAALRNPSGGLALAATAGELLARLMDRTNPAHEQARLAGLFGVFFGYPLEDIRAFMRHVDSGEDILISQHGKVQLSRYKNLGLFSSGAEGSQRYLQRWETATDYAYSRLKGLPDFEKISQGYFLIPGTPGASLGISAEEDLVFTRLAEQMAATKPVTILPVVSDKPAHEAMRQKIEEARAKHEPVQCLTVCTANYHRSAAMHWLLAAAAKREGLQDLQVISGGTDPALAQQGLDNSAFRAASAQSLESEAERELLLEAQKNYGMPKVMTPAMVREATVIIAAGEEHKRFIEQNFPEAAAKTFLFTELAPEIFPNKQDVPDPGKAEIAEQELFKLLRRGIETSIFPLFREHETRDVFTGAGEKGLLAITEIKLPTASQIGRIRGVLTQRGKTQNPPFTLPLIHAPPARQQLLEQLNSLLFSPAYTHFEVAAPQLALLISRALAWFQDLQGFQGRLVVLTDHPQIKEIGQPDIIGVSVNFKDDPVAWLHAIFQAAVEEGVISEGEIPIGLSPEGGRWYHASFPAAGEDASLRHYATLEIIRWIFSELHHRLTAQIKRPDLIISDVNSELYEIQELLLEVMEDEHKGITITQEEILEVVRQLHPGGRDRSLGSWHAASQTLLERKYWSVRGRQNEINRRIDHVEAAIHGLRSRLNGKAQALIQHAETRLSELRESNAAENLIEQIASGIEKLHDLSRPAGPADLTAQRIHDRIYFFDRVEYVGGSRSSGVFGLKEYPGLVFKVSSDNDKAKSEEEALHMWEVAKQAGYQLAEVDGLILMKIDGFGPVAYLDGVIAGRLAKPLPALESVIPAETRKRLLWTAMEFQGSLRQRGIQWLDVKPDNLGEIDGETVLIDNGFVSVQAELLGQNTVPAQGNSLGLEFFNQWRLERMMRRYAGKTQRALDNMMSINRAVRQERHRTLYYPASGRDVVRVLLAYDVEHLLAVDTEDPKTEEALKRLGIKVRVIEQSRLGRREKILQFNLAGKKRQITQMIGEAQGVRLADYLGTGQADIVHIRRPTGADQDISAPEDASRILPGIKWYLAQPVYDLVAPGGFLVLQEGNLATTYSIETDLSRKIAVPQKLLEILKLKELKIVPHVKTLGNEGVIYQKLEQIPQPVLDPLLKVTRNLSELAYHVHELKDGALWAIQPRWRFSDYKEMLSANLNDTHRFLLDAGVSPVDADSIVQDLMASSVREITAFQETVRRYLAKLDEAKAAPPAGGFNQEVIYHLFDTGLPTKKSSRRPPFFPLLNFVIKPQTLEDLENHPLFREIRVFASAQFSAASLGSESRREIPGINGVIFDALKLEDAGRVLAPVIYNLDQKYHALRPRYNGPAEPMPSRNVLAVFRFTAPGVIKIALSPALAEKKGEVYQYSHNELADKADLSDHSFGFAEFSIALDKTDVRFRPDINGPGYMMYGDVMHNQAVRTARVLVDVLKNVTDRAGNSLYTGEDIAKTGFLMDLTRLDELRQIFMLEEPEARQRIGGGKPHRLLLTGVAGLTLTDFSDPNDEVSPPLPVIPGKTPVAARRAIQYLNEAFEALLPLGRDKAGELMDRVSFTEDYLIRGDFAEAHKLLKRALPQIQRLENPKEAGREPVLIPEAVKNKIQEALAAVRGLIGSDRQAPASSLGEGEYHLIYAVNGYHRAKGDFEILIPSLLEIKQHALANGADTQDFVLWEERTFRLLDLRDSILDPLARVYASLPDQAKTMQSQKLGITPQELNVLAQFSTAWVQSVDFEAFIHQPVWDTAFSVIAKVLNHVMADASTDATWADFKKRLYGFAREQGMRVEGEIFTGEVVREQILKDTYLNFMGTAERQGDYSAFKDNAERYGKHLRLWLEARKQAKLARLKALKSGHEKRAVIFVEGVGHSHEHEDFWSEGFRLIAFEQPDVVLAPFTTQELLTPQALPVMRWYLLDALKEYLLPLAQDNEFAWRLAYNLMHGKPLQDSSLTPGPPLSETDIAGILRGQRGEAAKAILEWLRQNRKWLPEYQDLLEKRWTPSEHLQKSPFVRRDPPPIPGASLGSRQEARALFSEGRNPEFVLKIARSHEEGGMTEGVLFIQDEKALRWAMRELGFLDAPRQNFKEAFGAFSRGKLDRAIFERLNLAEGDSPEAGVSVVLFPGVLDAAQRSVQQEWAETFTNSLEAEDQVILVRQESNPFIDSLIRSAGLRGLRVKTIRDPLVSAAAIDRLIKGIDSSNPPRLSKLPIVISPVGEKRDLEVNFKGRKFKFNNQELQGRLDKVKVLSLLRKIADYPEKFNQIGIVPKGGYWEIGGAFAQFIEKLYSETRAEELQAKAA